MQRSILRVASVAVTVAVLVGILALPSAAASPRYFVTVSPNTIRPDRSTTIQVRVTNGVPNCVYLVSITVKEPHNVSHTKTVSFKASSSGNGGTTTPYPDTFSNAPNTHTTGTYHVAAMFKCGTTPYSTPAATATFRVSRDSD